MQGFDIVGMEPFVDWFNFMSYDIHGTWDGDSPYTVAVVQPHTNLTGTEYSTFFFAIYLLHNLAEYPFHAVSNFPQRYLKDLISFGEIRLIPPRWCLVWDFMADHSHSQILLALLLAVRSVVAETPDNALKHPEFFRTQKFKLS